MGINRLQCDSCGNTRDIQLVDNKFKCPICGTVNTVSHDMYHDPYRDAYSEQKGRLDAIDEYKKNMANHTIQQPGGNSQARSANQSATTKAASHSGGIGRFLVLAIVCLISYYLISSIVGSVASIMSSSSQTKQENDYGSNGVNQVSVPPEIECNDESEYVPPVVSLLSVKAYTDSALSETYCLDDIYGNNYQDGLELISDEPCMATYRLDGKYEKLTFYSAVRSWDAGCSGTGYIAIYCDNSLVYERDVDSLSEPDYVEINISGAKDVSIYVVSNYAGLVTTIYEPKLHSAA